MREEKEMAVTAHLGELRIRLIWVLAVFVLSFFGGFFVAGPLVKYLTANLEASIPLVLLGPADAFRVYIQMAFLFSVVVTLPVLLFHIWRFVTPGLTAKERSVTGRMIPVATLLFIAGLLFAYYYLFPLIIQFAINLSQGLSGETFFSMPQYFHFMMNIVLPVGVVFELPVIVLFLTRLGIVTPQLLRRMRKGAYLVLAVLAAAITPPDFVSQTLVFVPLILLYEISLWIAGRAYKKMQQKTADER
jgi:sec-independent protein translocase protein TatC